MGIFVKNVIHSLYIDEADWCLDIMKFPKSKIVPTKLSKQCKKP